MSLTLAIRVDGDQHRQKLRDFLSSDGAALCVRETVDGENPHYHAVLHTDRKIAAVRMALKRCLGVTGNGEYSVAQVKDLARYQRYMLKGDAKGVLPEIVIAIGMIYQSDSWVEEQHDAYWEENATLVKKRALEPVPAAVLSQCKEANVAWDRRDRIAEIYIRELVTRNKAINLFSLKSNVNLIQCQLCPGDQAIEDLARQV